MEESPPELMSKGSVVEVCSEEEGFCGAWFEATILNSKKKKKRVHVEYKTLCADEDLSVPLREHVDARFVRPLPPLGEQDLELHDVVDAFYKDGWWTGVVTRVFQGKRFVVTFQNPLDELQFGASSLRVHHDWVNHSWLRPPKQKVRGLLFAEGKEVEVSVLVHHNQEVWYPGTIVENHDDSSFLVEYQTLKEGTEETESVQVTVDCSNIRPRPPHLEDRFYDLLEKVDAFHEFGWYSGLITKELPDNRYLVFFQSMKRDGEFDHENIRPQLNWKDGKWWFISSQEEVTPRQENPGCLVVSELHDTSSGRECKSRITSKGKKTKHKVGVSCGSRESNPWKMMTDSKHIPVDVLEGTNSEETEFPPSSLGENDIDHVELGHEKSQDVASSPKKANHTLKITMHIQEQCTRGIDAVTPSRSSSQQNTAMTGKENGGGTLTSESRPSNIPGDTMLLDLTSRDQSSPKKRKKMEAREKNILSSRRKADQAGEEGNNGFAKDAELVKRDSGGKEVGLAFILGLECCKSSGSKAGKTSINGEEFLKLEGDQKKKLSNLPEHDKVDQSESGTNNHKRKRCRPKKVSAGSVNTESTEQKRVSSIDYINIKDSTMSEVDSHVAPDSLSMSMSGLLPADNYPIPIGECLKLVCTQSNRKYDSGSTIGKSSSRLPTDSNDQAIISEHERGRKKAKRRMSEKKLSQILDSSDGTVSKKPEPICITKEVVSTVQQETGMVDDQPLSMWFEKVHSSGTVNSSTPGDPTGDSTEMVEQFIELRETRKELNRHNTPAKYNKTDAVTIEEVDGENQVLVDEVEQSDKSRPAREELIEQTNLPEDKTAVLVSDHLDERGHALADGDTSIATTGEPEPFVKSSSLWTMFESMDTFRKMPQKPHFRPLQQFKESSREGYAIGFMVTFSSAVEKISRLRLDETKEKIDDILDSLKELESYGFGVQILQDRISELESIKEKHKKLLEEVDVINKKIMSCNFDKYDQDQEISEVTKQIKMLQERIAKAESMKEMKDRDLAALESRRHQAEETIRCARSSYEGLASGVL